MKSTRPAPQPQKQKQTATTAKKTVVRTNLFERENYKWMLIGAGVMIVGFFLMAGGRSEDPNVFNPSEIYSTVRITIAPILILAGLAIEIFAIFRQPKNNS